MEIYIVDDNADQQFLLYKLLRQLDKPYAVKFFENGRSLHKHMQQLSRSEQNQGFPDLLIVDFNMPVMNGTELLRLLRQPRLGHKINAIPIVVMSSEMSPSQIQQCYQAGANAVILKPLHFAVFKETIQSICRFWIH